MVIMANARKKLRRPRKGDTVRLRWNPEVPEELRGRRGIVVDNNRGEYLIDNEAIQPGEEYWGPFAANDLVVVIE